MTDYILVYGRTQEEHDKNLLKVLKRLEERGVVINSEKCEISKDISEPLWNLTNKWSKWQWTQVEQNLFDTLKNAFLTECLAYFDKDFLT